MISIINTKYYLSQKNAFLRKIKLVSTIVIIVNKLPFYYQSWESAEPMSDMSDMNDM